MRGKIGAMVAAVAAAASAAGAATWAKRRRRDTERPRKGGARPRTGGTPRATGTSAPAGSDDGTRSMTAKATEAPATPEPVAETSSLQPAAADDLTAIKGLGKVKVAKLAGMGITSYAQIAAWTDDDITEVGLAVNTSPGQIRREDWVGQARALTGD